MHRVLTLALLLAVAGLAAAAPPGAPAGPGTPEAALACVAARYHGEALAVRWRGEKGLWEVRWLTPAHSVLRVRLAPGCRFDEVEGVGQLEARRPPGAPAGGAR